VSLVVRQPWLPEVGSAGNALANPPTSNCSMQSATASCSSVEGWTTQGVPATAASTIVEYPEQTTASALRMYGRSDSTGDQSSSATLHTSYPCRRRCAATRDSEE